ncbi:MAG TPA: HEAT repeat domain-containing protein [Steroidobacteraceae bacterium]|nr:HEAT repeat domain-containing protein [Steroidobacteraceae bacterium]HNS27432.1 HEAT repeat domain-containing protein [Steroidobacteraceae bacterium]
MSFFSNLRADRFITQIIATKDPNDPETQKAAARLKSLGGAAVESLFAALADADKNATVVFVDVLASIVNAKNFHLFTRGLVEGGPRVVAGISWALSSSRAYPPHLLLEALQLEGISKSALVDIIATQKQRFSVRELLNAAYAQEPNEKAALFRIINDMADASALPELIGRLQGKDPIARLHLLNILSRFNTPAVQSALQDQLKDNNKLVRAAALAALHKMDGPIDVQRVCEMLRDPEIDVQNKAIDVVIKANDPETIKYLVPVLKDENEFARRAAVEVLNEVGTAKSVKFLLDAIKDDDWWVRSRAADALGKIGGPRVVDAVLQLIKDDDEDIRRAAIEILNQTKDERAVAHLIEATRDKDWWVSERAVDALAEIGSKRAVPRIVELLQTAPARSIPVAIRALAKLGDHKVIETLLPFLARPEKEIRVEAMGTLAKLADERRAEAIRVHLQAQTALPDPTIAQAAQHALTELDARFGSMLSSSGSGRGTLAATPVPGTVGHAPQRPTEAARTLLMSEAEVAQVVRQAEASTQPKLDISTLNPGDVIEGRYKYIERIGRGAFGTVLLMEDTVVDERLILKFLNPNVAQDEEIMKRFVHELRYSRKITHQNVIRIYDFLYIQGHYAISMEYFPSHTLGAEIVGEKPMELKRALGFAIDICTGMAVAHQVGVVHRDLKPANLLINNEGLLKIVDFGVAAAQREGDTQLTKTGYVIGSPKYMAPEQILGKKVDQRADVYALGVILYEMLTGVPPYSRGDHMAVMYQHVQGKARTVKDVNPSLPEGLSEVVMKAMAVDKTKRYQTMDEFKAALSRFL